MVTEQVIVLILLIGMLWTLPWKGYALWKSAKNGQKVWFVILFLVNTLAILEIIYITFFQKNKAVKVKPVFPTEQKNTVKKTSKKTKRKK